MGLLGQVFFNLHYMRKAKKFRAMGKEKLLALDDEVLYGAIACICDDAVYDIKEADVTKEQKLFYSLTRFEAEVNNGGLCQFFVNSSGACAPYISEALDAIGAQRIKALYDAFIADNKIDVNDLSSFKINTVEEYEAQTQRFDYDSFDEAFYKDEEFHKRMIDYVRKNIDKVIC